MSVTGVLCYELARWQILKERRFSTEQKGWAAGENPNVYDRATYQAWRQRELEAQFTRYFDPAEFADRDVLDFGCGGGELSLLCARHNARSVVGLEVNPEQYKLAANRFQQAEIAVRPSAVVATRLDQIPLDDHCCDIVLCFDVLEHVKAYRAIIREWHRVLRPGGHLLIWWVPYYHPYGHHVENLVPLPWIHVLFPERAIVEACARVYDMPEYRARLWDRDENGNKLPNKFHSFKELPDLNRLTIRRFESEVAETGFDVNRCEYHPIASSALARRISSRLIRLPILRELFSSCVIYDLQKSGSPSPS